LWAWKAGKLHCPPIDLPGEPRSVDFAPDGRTVAALCSDGHVVLIDPANGSVRLKKVVRPAYHANNWYYSNGKLVLAPAVAPCGSSPWRIAPALDAQTLEQKFTLEHRALSMGVFSPDGKLVSTASRDGTARVWDTETGKPQGARPLKHPDWIFRARSAPTARNS
jgi:WD40 repeat protein